MGSGSGELLGKIQKRRFAERSNAIERKYPNAGTVVDRQIL
jgi:hypothetical protein